jgi:hypothetical protein
MVLAVEPNAMRSFDPCRLGALECAAWLAYYRRDWRSVLSAVVAINRHGFGLPWPGAVWGAWLGMRAMQVWAPYPHNDREHSVRCMRRFYRLVADRHAEAFDPGRAAELDVDWWGIHRDGPAERLAEALAALSGHVYGVPQETVHAAALERAAAMGDCDEWVREGCDEHSPRIASMRAALVRSYASLLAAVHRA